ncbi:hypothetical protein [Rhodococcus sp. AG1013]|uniref:hypothetical protein n=1 Tax=unclassified Rhodococcus (in: high G+C Gram-positive bacteria) TaxID=192944 RepID=UPI0011C06FB6|nr:hypothetical protein [Rhodococcus sp. AG1013]
MPVRGILVATACVVVAVSWVFLVVDGVVEGNWMQLFWQSLLAMMALDWWRDRQGMPSMPGDTPRQRLTSGAIALVIGVGGGAMVVTQDALLGRIDGGILVVVALGFLYLILSSIRATNPPAEPA